MKSYQARLSNFWKNRLGKISVENHTRNKQKVYFSQDREIQLF